MRSRHLAGQSAGHPHSSRDGVLAHTEQRRRRASESVADRMKEERSAHYKHQRKLLASDAARAQAASHDRALRQQERL